MRKRFKVLTKDLESPFQNFQYKLGQWYHCGNFDPNPAHCCSRGFYATGIEGVTYSYRNKGGFVIVESQCKGLSVEIDRYKQRHEWYKPVRILDKPEILELTKRAEKKLGYILSEVIFPINPFEIKPPKITQKHIDLLLAWASVRDSVWASVRASARDSVWASVGDSVWDSVGDSARDSVWDSVGDSVRDSVWDSVGDSVWASVRASARDSVWDSVGAYISSLFPNIKKWKYINHREGENPFQSAIDLWRMGLIPSFDGGVWRLHGGKDARVLYEEGKDGSGEQGSKS